MNRYLMAAAGLIMLVPSPASAQYEENGTTQAYRDAYAECAQRADESTEIAEDGISDDWYQVLSKCLQDKGFTAPCEDEYPTEDMPEGCDESPNDMIDETRY